MKSSIVVLAIAIAVFSTATVAAAWKQEPTAFLGVEFGKPLSGSVPDCPGASYQMGPKLASRVLCKYKISDTLFQLFGLPSELEVIGYPYVLLKDGLVASFKFGTRHENYGTLKSLLTARYGAPMQTTYIPLQNALGAKVKAQVLQWKGRAVRIDLYEYVSEPNVSHATLTDMRLEVAGNAEKASAIQRGASKM